jgi:hypothetical protein
MKIVAEAGKGAIVLLHRPESADDLAARALPRSRQPARKFDLRNYGTGAQILRDLGVGKMKLLATPRKMPAMDGFGLEVTGYLEQGEMTWLKTTTSRNRSPTWTARACASASPSAASTPTSRRPAVGGGGGAGQGRGVGKDMCDHRAGCAGVAVGAARRWPSPASLTP